MVLNCHVVWFGTGETSRRVDLCRDQKPILVQCLSQRQMTSTSTMPGLIPHRRNSDEMDEDQELADGSVTPSTLMSNSSKRPRLDQEEISEVRSDLLCGHALAAVLLLFLYL